MLKPVIPTRSRLGRTSPFSPETFTQAPVDAATLLWDRGYGVIPFRIWKTPDGAIHKVPLAKSWKPYNLQRDYCESKVEESGCFGIIVPEGYIVVDLDVGSDDRSKFIGLNALLDLGEQHLDDLEFMSTLTIETPSGGSHLWFRTPNNVTIKNSASQIANCVDIRVPGKGLILMPPSQTPFGAYGLSFSFGGTPDVARCPWWLLHELTEATPPPVKAPAFDLTKAPEDVAKYLSHRGHQITNASVGSRNNILNAVAYATYHRVAEGVIPIEAADTALYSAAISAGLSDRETTATLGSARRAAGA